MRLANLQQFLAFFCQLHKYLSQNLGFDGFVRSINWSYQGIKSLFIVLEMYNFSACILRSVTHFDLKCMLSRKTVDFTDKTVLSTYLIQRLLLNHTRKYFLLDNVSISFPQSWILSSYLFCFTNFLVYISDNMDFKRCMQGMSKFSKNTGQ